MTETNKVDMRRMTDSPTDQDLDALTKLGKVHPKCDICGGPNGTIWLHCDSWTNWMRYGCGCNIMHCAKPECQDGAEVLSREKKAKNRLEAEESEREMLRTINPGQLSRLRSRYFNNFNCSDSFREWVASVVGAEKMQEFLDVDCAYCGHPLGPTRYTFEDENGQRRLATLNEIEMYCYATLHRDPVLQPFKYACEDIESDVKIGGMDDFGSEIGFQTPLWDYYERKGWEHREEPFNKERFDEAFKATSDTMKSCAGDGSNFWACGTFIYHMPTRKFLGKFTKWEGDRAQIVQTNYQQLKKEYEELHERLPHDHPDYWAASDLIEGKKKWSYYCCNACRKNDTDESSMVFL